MYRQHNDKEWKFKEQHAKMWKNIAGVKRYSRRRGFNIAGASAASGTGWVQQVSCCTAIDVSKATQQS